MCFVVGVTHACAQIRSPVPPLIARADHAVGLAKPHLFRPLLLSGADRRTNVSDDTRKAVAAPMLKKTLFVAIIRVGASASAIQPFVAEHLA
jgi:hypothetical protein